MATETEGDPRIGHSVRRVEDDRFIRGAGNYIDDIHLPGMLHMAILRSPYAHANLNSIDASRAQALPGVIAVVTGELMAQHNLAVDADALGGHAGGPGDGQGAVPGTGGRRGRRRRPVCREGRARADRRRLRPARRGDDPAAGARGRGAARSGPTRKARRTTTSTRWRPATRTRRTPRSRDATSSSRSTRSTRGATRHRSRRAAASRTSAPRPARRRST